MQVQYSVLDRRPENGLDRAGLMASAHSATARSPADFSPIAGSAQPEPLSRSRTVRCIKYKLIIDDFGGWELFQELLRALRRVADRHGCDIASVASRFVLDLPGVAAVIVGATSRAHLAANVAADARSS